MTPNFSNAPVELKLDILHLHTHLESAASNHPLPLIRTIHTHAPYCPSQGRFLKSPTAPCDRNYSLLGCLAGHVINHCGSIRPGTVITNFKTTRREMKSLPTIRVIAVSQFIKDQMVRAGYPAETVQVIYLPSSDTGENTPPPADPSFLFLGRMIPHKGVDWLLRSLLLSKRNSRLDLAGTGNSEHEYKALAEKLNLSDRVHFHGWLTPVRVQDLLKNARALIFPSIWHEPGGTVAYEAMMSGRAVISSRVGGLPEIVEHEKTGLLVPPGDEQALASAIDRLADDLPLATTMGQAGRDIILDHYTLKHHMTHLMNAYKEVITGR